MKKEATRYMQPGATVIWCKTGWAVVAYEFVIVKGNLDPDTLKANGPALTEKHIKNVFDCTPEDGCWMIERSKDDFVQRTTHIKISSFGFCRGKVSKEGNFRPHKPGMDNFDGAVYDVRMINSIWRNNPHISKVVLAELIGEWYTPLYFSLGDYKGAIAQPYYKAMYAEEEEP